MTNESESETDGFGEVRTDTLFVSADLEALDELITPDVTVHVHRVVVEMAGGELEIEQDDGTMVVSRNE